MILSDTDIIIREYIDLSDKDTLHKVVAMQEANQNQFLVALTSKLYDKIQEKATKIDYTTIEISKGDITKIQNYKSMVECLGIIRQLVLEYKEQTLPVDIVADAINNIKTRKQLFTKAFAIGSSFPILTYDNIVLAIVESISFLITTCIEYVKDPGSDTFQMALDKVAYNRTEQNLLFNTLRKFNESCRTKELDKALNMIMSQAISNREAAELKEEDDIRIANDHPFLTDEEEGDDIVVHDEKLAEGKIGTVLSYAGTKILLWIAKLFIPIIRNITYYFFYHKQKISNYYEDQANLLQMNAYNVQANQNLSADKRAKIFAKQMKIVEKYRKRSNEMNIDYVAAKNNSEKLSSAEVRNFKAEDLEDNINSDTGEDHSNYGSIFEAEITKDYEPITKFETPFEFSCF